MKNIPSNGNSKHKGLGHVVEVLEEQAGFRVSGAADEWRVWRDLRGFVVCQTKETMVRSSMASEFRGHGRVLSSRSDMI